MNELAPYRTRIIFANGVEAETVTYHSEDLDEGEVVGDVADILHGDARPGWRTIGDVICFSQAVCGVQVEQYATPTER